MGQDYYIQLKNGAEFAGSFTWLCEGLGIVKHHITIGNKANVQVERMIQMLKDCILCSLMKEPASFWTNHLALAHVLLLMISSWMMSVVLYLLAMGHQPLIPSLAITGLPLLPD